MMSQAHSLAGDFRDELKAWIACLSFGMEQGWKPPQPWRAPSGSVADEAPAENCDTSRSCLLVLSTYEHLSKGDMAFLVRDTDLRNPTVIEHWTWRQCESM